MLSNRIGPLTIAYVYYLHCSELTARPEPIPHWLETTWLAAVVAVLSRPQHRDLRRIMPHRAESSSEAWLTIRIVVATFTPHSAFDRLERRSSVVSSAEYALKFETI